MQRSQKILWSVVAAVVVAIIIFAGVFYSKKGNQAQTPVSTQPVQTQPTPAPTNPAPAPTPTPAPTSKPVAVVVNSVAPNSAAVGSQITITGTGFLVPNTVLFNGLVAGQNVSFASLSSGKEVMTIMVPASLTPDCASVAQQACPMIAYQTTAGNYKVSVQNKNGTSNTVAFTVIQ